MFARIVGVFAFAAALATASCSSSDTNVPDAGAIGDGGGGGDDSSFDDSGGCPSTCPNGASCLGGTCVCPGGEVICGNDCVDLTSDRNNCGNCGVTCTGSCSLSNCVK